MSPATLPLDVFECILDEVALMDEHDSEQETLRTSYCKKGSYPTLKACALVSRDFRHLSQSRLFRTINLCLKIAPYKMLDDGQPSTVADDPEYVRLNEILTESPRLAKYIRRLSINAKRENKNPIRKWRTFAGFQSLCFYDLLVKLDNVTALDISGDIILWESTLPAIKKALFNIMFSPQITSVRLHQVLYLPAIFGRYMERIPTLEISCVHFNHHKEDDDTFYALETDNSHDTRLKFLVLPHRGMMDVDRQTLEPLITTIERSRCNLEKLVISGDHTYQSPYLQVSVIDMGLIALSAQRNSLKELSIDSPGIHDISSYIDLRTLRLRCFINHPSIFDGIQDIIKTLSTLPANHQIRHLYISSELPLEKLMHIVQQAVDKPILDSWKTLDEMLTDSRFSKLEEVNFNFQFRLLKFERPILESLVPLTYKKGICKAVQLWKRTPLNHVGLKHTSDSVPRSTRWYSTPLY